MQPRYQTSQPTPERTTGSDVARLVVASWELVSKGTFAEREQALGGPTDDSREKLIKCDLQWVSAEFGKRRTGLFKRPPSYLDPDQPKN